MVVTSEDCWIWLAGHLMGQQSNLLSSVSSCILQPHSHKAIPNRHSSLPPNMMMDQRYTEVSIAKEIISSSCLLYVFMLHEMANCAYFKRFMKEDMHIVKGHSSNDISQSTKKRRGW